MLTRTITLALLLCLSAAEYATAQRTITFSASHAHAAVPLALDSIQVRNLTRMRDTVLVGVNTLDLDWITSATPTPAPRTFDLGPAFPNTFEGWTAFDVSLPEAGELTLLLYATDGRLLLREGYTLAPGQHGFTLHAGTLPAGVYVLVASGSERVRSQKLLRLPFGGSGPASFVYRGHDARQSLPRLAADSYRFTAFAESFETAVLDNMTPDAGVNIAFTLTPRTVPSIDPASLDGRTGTSYTWTVQAALRPASIRCEWTFGDGQSATQRNQLQATHSYATAGSFDLRVAVYNDRNGNFYGEAEAHAEITPPPVSVRVRPDVTDGLTDVEYQWTAEVTNPPARLRYEWKFGDGGTLQRDNASGAEHLYDTPGDYEVSVEIFDIDAGMRRVGGDTAIAYIRANGRIYSGPPVEAVRAQVPAGGGTVQVSQPGTPVTGLGITVPQGSYTSTREFVVSYAPVTGHGMGEDFTPLTPLITVQNGGGYADEPMTLCIPINLPPDHFAMAFFYDHVTGELEGIPPVRLDRDMICVATRHFSQEIVGLGKNAAGAAVPYIQLIVAAVAKSELKGSILSKFRPLMDDWEFPNFGSYIAAGGHCAGQSLAAMWYYSARRLKLADPPLFERFGEVHADSMWADNTHGYRFSSILQKDMNWDAATAWKQTFENIGTGVYSADSLHFLSFKYAIKKTDKPQFIYISRIGGAHAMIVYGVDGDRILIADPNYPGEQRSTTLGNGILQPYTSKPNANGQSVQYPNIKYIAKTAMISFEGIAQRWEQVEKGSIGTIAPNTFPPTEVLMLKDGQGEPLPASLQTTEETISLYARCPTCVETYPTDQRALVILTEENGRFITTTDGNGLIVLPVRPGKQRYGMEIYGWPSVGAGGEFIDFRWVDIEKQASAVMTWAFRVDCSDDPGNWGRLEQDDTEYQSRGAWNRNVYTAVFDSVFENNIRYRIEMTAVIDTITNALVSIEHYSAMMVPGAGTVSDLTIRCSSLPLLSAGPDGLVYGSSGPGTCTYVQQFTGRSVVWCGDILAYDCEPYGEEQEEAFIHLTLPPRE
jgi:hypothetical protein